MKISTKSLPEQQKFEAATTEKEGQIQFYITIGGTLVPEEDAESFVARIPKLTPSTVTETSAELTEDWRAMGKAMDKIPASNDVTKEELLKARWLQRRTVRQRSGQSSIRWTRRRMPSAASPVIWRFLCPLTIRHSSDRRQPAHAAMYSYICIARTAPRP